MSMVIPKSEIYIQVILQNRQIEMKISHEVQLSRIPIPLPNDMFEKSKSHYPFQKDPLYIFKDFGGVYRNSMTRHDSCSKTKGRPPLKIIVFFRALPELPLPPPPLSGNFFGRQK